MGTAVGAREGCGHGGELESEGELSEAEKGMEDRETEGRVG